jgi:hypothetical protein
MPEWLVACLCFLMTSAVTLVQDACCVVKGYVRGESFYRGRPTSYWSQKICSCPNPPRYERWFLRPAFRPTPASWLDQLKQTAGFGRPVYTFHVRPLRDEDAAAVPVLVELLRDPDAGVRMYVAETLGPLGGKAKAAVPALREALRDDGVGGFGMQVRGKAAESLRLIEKALATDGSSR